jgi:hypothetical protein
VESKTKLLDQMRIAMRLRHMSLCTDKAYVQWARRFILFQNKRYPKDMGAEDIRAFLTASAVERQVAASTQNGAPSVSVPLRGRLLCRDLQGPVRSVCHAALRSEVSRQAVEAGQRSETLHGHFQRLCSRKAALQCRLHVLSSTRGLVSIRPHEMRISNTRNRPGKGPA